MAEFLVTTLTILAASIACALLGLLALVLAAAVPLSLTRGQCIECKKFKCPMVGKGFARRRQHAYCPDCMPELYELPSAGEGKS